MQVGPHSRRSDGNSPWHENGASGAFEIIRCLSTLVLWFSSAFPNALNLVMSDKKAKSKKVRNLATRECKRVVIDGVPVTSSLLAWVEDLRAISDVCTGLVQVYSVPDE